MPTDKRTELHIERLLFKSPTHLIQTMEKQIHFKASYYEMPQILQVLHLDIPSTKLHPPNTVPQTDPKPFF